MDHQKEYLNAYKLVMEAINDDDYEDYLVLDRALIVADQFCDLRYATTALLHGLVEGGNVMVVNLLGFGFSATVISAVAALTQHRKEIGAQMDESVHRHIARVAENYRAKAIKVAELEFEINNFFEMNGAASLDELDRNNAIHQYLTTVE